MIESLAAREFMEKRTLGTVTKVCNSRVLKGDAETECSIHQDRNSGGENRALERWS